jgi:cysteine synthase A
MLAFAPVADSVLDLVGATPLIALRIEAQARARIWMKAEHLNPGGSTKDRIALAMICAAEQDGRLKPGGTVVEPTSGNTGVGLAMVCAVKGYRCVLTMPDSMSLERRELLRSYGAEVVLTPAERQMDGAVARAREMASELDGAFMPSQFDNATNPQIHAQTTAMEILQAMEGVPIAAFVAGVGTGGTVSGVGRVLKSRNVDTRVVAVEPANCATISTGHVGPTKIQGLGAGFVPANYDASVVNEVRTVADAQAFQMKGRLAREEGLLVGVSSGAAVLVALAIARELGPEHDVVTVLPDTGERYFSLAEYFSDAVG